MPVLHINNLAEDEEAYVENGAEKNLVESISLGGTSLSINDKNINLELADANDIIHLFMDTYKVVRNHGIVFDGDDQIITWIIMMSSNLNTFFSLTLSGIIDNLDRAININQIASVSTNVEGSLTPLSESSFEIELKFSNDVYVEILGFKFKIKKDSKLRGKGNITNGEFQFKEDGALTGQYLSTLDDMQIIEGFTLERVYNE